MNHQTIIPLAEASETLKAALQKKTEIQMKILALEGEKAALLDNIRLADTAVLEKEKHIMSEAEMIISGRPKEATPDFNPKLDALSKQIRVLREALKIHERNIEEIRSKEGARLGAAYAKPYREHAAKVAAALAALGEALERENAFRLAVLIDNDYPVYSIGHIFTIPRLGVPSDQFSTITRLLAEAREHGLLN